MSPGSLAAKPKAPRMRKLLRHRTTKAFVTAEGTWGNSLDQAMDIGQVPSGDVRLPGKAQELEVYYSFGHFQPTEWDFSLPLG